MEAKRWQEIKRIYESALELAPESMKVSKSGLVTWTPPEALPQSGEKVIVLVKDQSGEEVFHTFVVSSTTERPEEPPRKEPKPGRTPKPAG